MDLPDYAAIGAASSGKTFAMSRCIEKPVAQAVKARNEWIEACAKECLPPAVFKELKNRGPDAQPFCAYYAAKRCIIWVHPDREEFWYEGKLFSTRQS